MAEPAVLDTADPSATEEPPPSGEAPGDAGEPAASSARPAGASEKAPWHFKLLVAVVVIYLGWRLIQLITWLVR